MPARHCRTSNDVRTHQRVIWRKEGRARDHRDHGGLKSAVDRYLKSRVVRIRERAHEIFDEPESRLSKAIHRASGETARDRSAHSSGRLRRGAARPNA